MIERGGARNMVKCFGLMAKLVVIGVLGHRKTRVLFEDLNCDLECGFVWGLGSRWKRFSRCTS
jgi:hypothetical protein